MALKIPNSFITPAIRIAAAGLGAAVAGPLGGALGAVIGNALGEPAAKLISTYTEKFGEEAAKKLLDTGTESLVEKLKKGAPDLESAYRQAFRLSLSEIRIHAEPGFDDWFTNWDRSLKAFVPLNLDEIRPDQLVSEKVESLFRRTMERLDAQGTAIQQNNPSLNLKTRPAPDALLVELRDRLPEVFEKNFSSMIVQPDYEQAWKQAELAFRTSQEAALHQIDLRTERIDLKTDALPRVEQKIDDLSRKFDESFQRSYEEALKKGIVSELKIEALEAEKVRLAEELRKLQEQLASRSSEPVAVQLSDLLKAQDFDGALRLKSQQVEMRREESSKLPRDLYELGTIHELRFEWPEALAAYREAWERSKDPSVGFNYAYMAQRLNRFAEAITTYETLLNIFTDPASIANTLNNLAIMYRATQKVQKAEEAHCKALALRRELADANPDVYLPDVAITLNNLATLYSATQRIQKAEVTYIEALAIRRQLASVKPEVYKPGVATTLNNLAALYGATQRFGNAARAYAEALAIRRQLAVVKPDAYMPDVATTLNNIACLYSDTGHIQEAEEAHVEALAIRRRLAKSRPDTYMPDVAISLNNLAILFRDTQRIQKSEETYVEALAISRALAEANSDAYMPQVATTLSNLGNLYSATGNVSKAEQAYMESLTIRRKLAEANPNTYASQLANTLNNLSHLYYCGERIEDAAKCASEAERILDPLWRANPKVHCDLMARILWARALIGEASKMPGPEICSLGRRALAATYDPVLKGTIQELIDRTSADSRG